MQGLSGEEAKIRLKRFGKNKLEKTKKRDLLAILIDQFNSPLILLLLSAAIISFLLTNISNDRSNIIDSILILIIVLFSGITGFIQDYKAEKTIEELKNMSAPKAKVIRDGKIKEINAEEVVPGDIIIVQEGDIIPADAKIIEGELQVDESMLTGEAKGVDKKKLEVIYMNSYVLRGEAKAIVEKTGMKTKIGLIAKKLGEIKEDKTTFEKDIEDFSKKTTYFILGLIVVLFLFSLTKYDIYLSFMTAISLAVAAIPEGLPAIVVLTLALAAKEMSKRNALVRKLSVIDSIGAIDIICTDKTGTLTKNKMEVVRIKEYDKKIYLCANICNNVKKQDNKYFGDQTEIAIKRFVENKEEKGWKRIKEMAFSSERKMMSVIAKKQKKIMFSKGAPEIILEKSRYIEKEGKIKKLSKKDSDEIKKEIERFAKQALRVIAFAYKEIKENDEEDELIFLGIMGIKDPIKEGVKEAIKECKQAGIRVVMLTGDNIITAKAIAKEAGIESTGAIEGKDLEDMSNDELEDMLKKGVNIFARINPFHKLKILEILKKDNQVAMTGDGVNDSLALKKADVGVAMGKRGTEVAKQASDIILLDDNFATIVKAVKEGRRVFDNIRKFVNYLFVTNFAEVAVLFISTLLFVLKDPIIMPVQLLWINLLTDGFPAIALGMDPAKKDIMKEPPRKKNEPIINKRLWWKIGTIGIEKTIILLLTFYIIFLYQGEIKARSALFTGFVLYEFVRLATIRYSDKIKLLENKWLVGAVLLSLILQLIVIYSPLNNYFDVVPLELFEWSVLIIGTIVGYLIGIIITKYIDEKVSG